MKSLVIAVATLSLVQVSFAECTGMHRVAHDSNHCADFASEPMSIPFPDTPACQFDKKPYVQLESVTHVPGDVLQFKSIEASTKRVDFLISTRGTRNSKICAPADVKWTATAR